MNNRHLTALGEAILQKNVHILQLLISKGADVHRVSNGFFEKDVSLADCVFVGIACCI